MHILYSDTDITRKEHVKDMLGNMGYEVSLVCHVNQAILYLNNRRVDQVILHIDESQQDAILELLYLRNQAADPQIRTMPVSVCGPLQSPAYELRLQAMGVERQLDLVELMYRRPDNGVAEE